MRLFLPVAYVFLIVLGKNASVNGELTSANDNFNYHSMTVQPVVDDEKFSNSLKVLAIKTSRIKRDFKPGEKPYKAAEDGARKSKKRQISRKENLEKLKKRRARPQPRPRTVNNAESHVQTEEKEEEIHKVTIKKTLPSKNVTRAAILKKPSATLKEGPSIPWNGPARLRRPRLMNMRAKPLDEVQEDIAFLMPLSNDDKEPKRVKPRDVNLILRMNQRNPKILIRRYKPYFNVVNYPLTNNKRRPLAAAKKRLRQKRKQRRKRKKIMRHQSENYFPFAGSLSASQVSCNTEHPKSQMSFTYPSPPYKQAETSVSGPAFSMFESSQQSTNPVSYNTPNSNYVRSSNKRLEEKFPVIEAPLYVADNSIHIPFKHDVKPSKSFFDRTTTEEYKIEDMEEKPVEAGYDVHEDVNNTNELDENTENEEADDVIQYDEAEPKENDGQNAEYEENTEAPAVQDAEYENDEQESAPRGLVEFIRGFQARLPKIPPSKWIKSKNLA